MALPPPASPPAAPLQTAEELLAVHARAVDELERLVDASVRGHVVGASGFLRISLPLSKDPPEVVAEVVERFRAAGWSTAIVSRQMLALKDGKLIHTEEPPLDLPYPALYLVP
jgi:hypothetical protein